MAANVTILTLEPDGADWRAHVEYDPRNNSAELVLIDNNKSLSRIDLTNDDCRIIAAALIAAAEYINSYVPRRRGALGKSS